MMFNSVLPLALLASLAAADYRCATNAGSFTITNDIAKAAVANGGTNTKTSSRFPHGFAGMSGNGTPGDHLHKGTQLKFYGADSRCNEKQDDDPEKSNLLEFPVFQNGKSFNKDEKRDKGVLTPARVVYVKSDMTLCGVMTHAVKNTDGSGEGDFRVCDSN
ncbi:hypothetical protein JX265_003235 [Neoarthrinium moseri]|uniref:Uncharacterized protein n=1 Tax=Neoarthrinium moseri TaxID=1658444 RepID=A0A9Q0ASN1_9PEZI|nr:uncharacterized protein JN550_005525 [Neoarthrinium moseri]KAI1852748.1 hypothetical protein JX266_002289 [Neoarthrinium moseri]KAI1869935.1 hypothetical protein JN550_005525 [Neoarthrinium moseri]KAI1879058.1 hypothetical protein JX265_003235 [Neoarthrinium moseri]